MNLASPATGAKKGYTPTVGFSSSSSSSSPLLPLRKVEVYRIKAGQQDRTSFCLCYINTHDPTVASRVFGELATEVLDEVIAGKSELEQEDLLHMHLARLSLAPGVVYRSDETTRSCGMLDDEDQENPPNAYQMVESFEALLERDEALKKKFRKLQRTQAGWSDSEDEAAAEDAEEKGIGSDEEKGSVDDLEDDDEEEEEDSEMDSEDKEFLASDDEPSVHDSEEFSDDANLRSLPKEKASKKRKKVPKEPENTEQKNYKRLHQFPASDSEDDESEEEHEEEESSSSSSSSDEDVPIRRRKNPHRPGGRDRVLKDPEGSDVEDPDSE